MKYTNKSTNETISLQHFVTNRIQQHNQYQDAEPFEIPNTFLICPYHTSTGELKGAVIIHDYDDVEQHCEISVAETEGFKLFTKKVLLDVYDKIFSIGKYNKSKTFAPVGLNCRLVYAKISSNNTQLKNAMQRLGFQFVTLPDKIAKNHDEHIGYLYKETWMQVRYRFTKEFDRLKSENKQLKEKLNGK